MSADNWTICPKCSGKAVMDGAAKVLKMVESYGKVTPEEFLKLRTEADERPVLEDTLREDYELGVDHLGEFTVSYRCSCDCGFSFEFRHSEKAKP